MNASRRRLATLAARLGVCVAVVLSLAAYSAEAQPVISSLDAAFAASTVESVGAIIRQEYFDEDVATSVQAALTAAIASGQYSSLTSRDGLAQTLTRDLYGLTHDKHLSVTVRRPPLALASGGGPVSPQRDRPTNAGFRRVEILPGNVGYLDLTMFLRPVEHRDALSAAMQQLKSADALILDMRDNSGGSPATVALLLSYLFDEPSLPLFDIVPRAGDTEHYATEPASAHIARNGRRPIWVLTSERTFSGGEGLAFLLQERQRTQVIGARTAGAANPGRPYAVNEAFEVTVPNGHIRTAVTQRNWEGDGVTPDVRVPADRALDVALERARQALQGRRAP